MENFDWMLSYQISEKKQLKFVKMCFLENLMSAFKHFFSIPSHLV